jgi:hypothetical protein
MAILESYQKDKCQLYFYISQKPYHL